MYKKQLTDLTLVGLKHFFNLDPYIVTQFFLMILLMFIVFRRSIADAARHVWVSLLKIKEIIKQDLNQPLELNLGFLKK